MKNIIVIVGPTGVGKTKLSIELAKRLDAEIINGDSVSIYKDLNIGSAKPTKEEMDGVIHHLIDIKEVEDDYSVYDYQIEGRRVLDNLIKKDKNVIIVGGTGLYIKALLFDYKFEHEKENFDFSELSNVDIYNKIKEMLNEDFDIHINNRKRLIRYLNKLLNQEEITNNKDKLLYDNCIFIGLTSEREIVYKRINDRVDYMINNGLLDEVSSLRDKYDNSRVLNSAIGYKEFKDYLKGEESLNDVVEEIKKNSRRFAKRQYTFFNHQFDVKWFDTNFYDFNITIDKVYEYIKGIK